MLQVSAPSPYRSETIEQFKERTLDKLRDVRCPDHDQAPRLSFRGATLREVSIQMSACCPKLAAIANQRIAQGPESRVQA